MYAGGGHGPCTAPSEAQQRLRQFVDEVERSRPRQGTVSVGEWLRTRHREDAAPRLRIKTQERYADIIGQDLIPHIGHGWLTL